MKTVQKRLEKQRRGGGFGKGGQREISSEAKPKLACLCWIDRIFYIEGIRTLIIAFAMLGTFQRLAKKPRRTRRTGNLIERDYLSIW